MKAAMFQTAVIHQTIKLTAQEIASNVRMVVEERARALLEGVCGEHGYVRSGTLRMVHMAPGKLTNIDMGRRYSFDATFKADVCNPVVGLRFNAIVRSVNRFGVLAEGGYYDDDGTMVPVIEVVVVRNTATVVNEVDVGELQAGDELGIELLGRRFEMRDVRISAYGRAVKDVEDAEPIPVIGPLVGSPERDVQLQPDSSDNDATSDDDDAVSSSATSLEDSSSSSESADEDNMFDEGASSSSTGSDSGHDHSL